MSDKPITFFLDNTFAGHRIPRLLRHAKVTVERLVDVFGRNDVEDAEWIPHISAPPYEWVAITKDNGILEKPYEFTAICDYRARIVLFPRGEDLSADQVAERFLDRLPAILHVLSYQAGPLLFFLEPGTMRVVP